MLIGTKNGVLSLLNVPSEKIAEEEVEEEDRDELQKQQILENELELVGRFHTDKINAVKPLGPTSQMASISADGTVAIWEVSNQQQLSVTHMPAEPVSLDASKEGSVIFVGTAIGTFRIIDVTNREKPRVIK